MGVKMMLVDDKMHSCPKRIDIRGLLYWYTITIQLSLDMLLFSALLLSNATYNTEFLIK